MLKRALIVAAAAFYLPSQAYAFGLKSHLWIADQVWQDLADCRLAIAGQDFEIQREQCDDIRGNRNAFIAGALGPDVFPDLLIGQAVVHPGIQGGLQASDWLAQLLAVAEEPEEVAFSWGYAMHYAGDVFAHTYINNYAGDVFDLTQGGTPNVELRHFRLEKYIDQHLDYYYDPALLRVPRKFLARVMVRRNYRANGVVPRIPTLHMNAMQTAFELAKQARDVKAQELLAESVDRMSVKLGDLSAVEARLGLRASNGVPFDRRSPQARQLTGVQRERLRRAHLSYQQAVDRWRRDRALVEMTKAWVADIEAIGELYIDASLDFARNMVVLTGKAPEPYEKQKGALQPYRRWFGCYAPILRGQPLSLGTATCEQLDQLGADIDFREAALRAASGWKVRSIYLTLLEAQRYLVDAAGRAMLKVGGVADPNVASLVEEISDPAMVDVDALNDAFLNAPNQQLAFGCVVDWIDADLGLRATAPLVDGGCDGAPRLGATFNPADFKPLAYALTLAKVSLLDQSELRSLVTRFGGDPAHMRLTAHNRYSVLIDTVKSLDGNHQWMPQSLPLPQRRRFSRKTKYVSAGYGLTEDKQRGFPLYQSEALRRGPFTALFPAPFEGSILHRREMQAPHYPFRPCEGDPLRSTGTAGRVVVC